MLTYKKVQNKGHKKAYLEIKNYEEVFTIGIT